MAIHSPLSPEHRGFVPLSTSRSNREHHEGGIPLTHIRSGASSSGMRAPNQVTFEEPDINGGDTEKDAEFRPGVGGRRKVHRDFHRQDTGESEGVSLNAMGRLYNKIVGFSVLTRYLVYVLPVALLLAIPLIVLPVTDNDTRVGSHTDSHGTKTEGPKLFRLFLWLEVAWLTLWGAKLVAKLVPAVFMFFCGVVSSGTRKYATVLRQLEIPLSLFFWALASWLVFKFLCYQDSVTWVHNLVRILLALFICSACFLAEKAFIQVISISYHQRSFANRIKASKREVYLLGLMFDASRKLFPMYGPEFEEEDYIINTSIESIIGKSIGKGRPAHMRGASVNPMRIIGDVGRIGGKVTSVFGNIASEVTGKKVFNPNSAHSIVVTALERVRSSEAMARRIWMSFVAEDSESLAIEDIVEVLGSQYREEAEECFAAIDADSNGDISLEEMVRKVVEIGKERKAITHSMKDIGQALNAFDQILMFCVCLLIIFIFLVVFQSSLLTTISTAGTALLSLSFIFSVTSQEILGSCIFLFVKHPYDVGDRVDVVGNSGQLQLIVEKISLLYTVFTRIDKMQVVQVPNIQLNNLFIENVTRSNAMPENFEISVSFDTPFEDLELLRLEMEKFVRSPENSRDFQPDINITVSGVSNLDKLVINMSILHKSNWHNDSVRATRRSKFMCALALALKRIPINGPGGGGEVLGGPTNPAYSVAVDDGFASDARTKAAAAADAARLAPANPAGAAEPGGAAEQAAAADLNARRPLSDLDDWGYDNTLNSRDGSADRTRAAAPAATAAAPAAAHHNMLSPADSLRYGNTRSLSTRGSMRGRRKPGEGLSASAMEGASASAAAPVMVDRDSAAASYGRMSFDVESQTGITRQQQQSHHDVAAAAPAAVPDYGYLPPPVQSSASLSRQRSITSTRSKPAERQSRLSEQ